MSDSNEKSVEELIQALWDKDEQIRQQAINALAEIGQAAVPALLVALKSDDHSSEARGFENQCLREAIVSIGEPAFEALIAALRPRSHMVRAAAKTLPLFKDPRAVQPLIAALLDEQQDVNSKCYIIDALGILKDPSAFHYLADVLRHESASVRTTTAHALVNYADPSVIPLIFTNLFRPPGSHEYYGQGLYRSDTLYALVRFGKPAYEFAINALKDPSYDVRLAASELIDLGKQLGKFPNVEIQVHPFIPYVEASVTLLSEDDGGRTMPLDLNNERASYRPHIVVGSSTQRRAILRNGNVIDEEYLGVQFHPASMLIHPGETALVRMDLIYYPAQGYEKVIPGAEFTLREGGKIVGYGVINHIVLAVGE